MLKKHETGHVYVANVNFVCESLKRNVVKYHHQKKKTVDKHIPILFIGNQTISLGIGVKG